MVREKVSKLNYLVASRYLDMVFRIIFDRYIPFLDVIARRGPLDKAKVDFLLYMCLHDICIAKF